MEKHHHNSSSSIISRGERLCASLLLPPSTMGLTQRRHHLQQPRQDRKRLDEARSSIRSLYFPTKITHFVFLTSVILYLSIYHLRSEDVHLLLGSSSSLVEVRSPPDTPPTSFLSSEDSTTKHKDAPTSVAVPHDAHLDSYSPHHHPFLSEPPSTKEPMQVHVLTGPTDTISAPTRFIIEGIERSEYLKLVHISFLEQADNAVKVLEVNAVVKKTPILWIVDVWALAHDCHHIETMIHHAKDFDNKKQQQQKGGHLLLIDYSGSAKQLPCLDVVHDLVGDKWRVAQRGITQGRTWNSDKNWVNVGHVVAPNDKNTVMHAPYPVREIIVTTVAAYMEHQRKERGHDKAIRPVDAVRSTDVMLFWRKGDTSHYANLRREVGGVITSLHSMELAERNLRTLVRFFGDDAVESMEQNLVNGKYVAEMMGTKIIVVAQRDEWEDHYRFMESLASGALVFTDIMVGLPAGVVHQKNVIMYDSAASLREQLVYYLHPDNDRERLSIAKKGWELVMGHHRCWHRMEELVFGEALTAVDDAYDATPPPRRKRTKAGKIITKEPALALTDGSLADEKSES